MNSATLLFVKQSLNKTYHLHKPTTASIKAFKENLVHLIIQIDEKESREGAKIFVQNLMAETYFASDYYETDDYSSPVCYAHVSGLRGEFSDRFLPETKKSDNNCNSLADTSHYNLKAANPNLMEAIYILKLCFKEILGNKPANQPANSNALEKQIDELLYQLYELTPEEIAILDGS